MDFTSKGNNTGYWQWELFIILNEYLGKMVKIGAALCLRIRVISYMCFKIGQLKLTRCELMQPIGVVDFDNTSSCNDPMIS